MLACVCMYYSCGLMKESKYFNIKLVYQISFLLFPPPFPGPIITKFSKLCRSWVKQPLFFYIYTLVVLLLIYSVVPPPYIYIYIYIPLYYKAIILPYMFCKHLLCKLLYKSSYMRGLTCTFQLLYIYKKPQI